MPVSYEQATEKLRTLINGIPNVTEGAAVAVPLTTALLTLEQAYNEARKREEPEPPAE